MGDYDPAVGATDAIWALGFRLDAIARAHSKAVDAHGGTYGECLECGDEWPCPTYIWAMDPTIESDCAWNAAECSFDGHDHVASILYGTAHGDPHHTAANGEGDGE